MRPARRGRSGTSRSRTPGGGGDNFPPPPAPRYNPLIVLRDADLDFAVDAAAFGAFLHQGQICMSARRIVVERPIADEFTQRLAEKTKGLKAGDPKEPDTIIGPLINESALQSVKDRVDDAVAKGAKVLAGGEAVGSVYKATLLADVPEDSEL